LATRPAKSFWKKPRLWRRTYLCVCQRTRVVTGPAITWFLMRSWIVETTGLAMTATKAIQRSVRPWSRTNVSGVWAAFIMSTRLPTNAISATSIRAPRKPATSSTAKAGQTGLTK